MTVKEYLEDPKRLTGSATVVAIIPGDKPVVRLDRTLFHAQGGGQKADRGRLGPTQVLHAAHNAADVDHFVESLEGLEVGAVVQLEVDAGWRQLNAAYHTAGHLLAAVVEAMYPGMKAVSGHQWPGEARVEFEGPIAAADVSLDLLNERMTREIERAIPVVIDWPAPEPRTIKIGAYPNMACGGTHVANLSEVGGAMVRSMKQKSGRLRVSYDLGT